jgi:hypothetical protein
MMIQVGARIRRHLVTACSLLSLSVAILPGRAVAGISSAKISELPAVWADFIIATAPNSILPPDEENERLLTKSFIPPDSLLSQASARAALMNFSQVVVVGVLTLADSRRSDLHIPLTSGETVDLHLVEIVLGGTVIAFSPLTRTVLTSSPLLGVRRLNLKEEPSPARLADEVAKATTDFGRRAQERARRIFSRTVAAAVDKGAFGGAVLSAGRADGVLPGTVVSVVGSSAGGGVDCVAKDVRQHDAHLDCAGNVPSDATGTYLRPAGENTSRYQVVDATITSPKAIELLHVSIASDEAMVAFALSDALAAEGLTVLPPKSAEGERLQNDALRRFAAHHGLTESELETFSLKFPPAEVQLSVVVDGYNTAVVKQSRVERIRAHKAWVKVSDSAGKVAEGVGVLLVNEIPDWQEDAPHSADARLAIRRAVRCAAERFLGEEDKACG